MLRRILCLIMLIVSMAVICPMSVLADTPSNDPLTAASPDIPDLFSPENNSEPYLTTYKDNYYLDITTGMFSIDTTTNALANVVFDVQKGLAYLLVLAFYYAFEFSFFEWFKDLVQLFIQNMQTQLFNNLSMIILACMGFYFFVKTLQRQTIQVWIAFFQTVVILAFAMYFYTHPVQILQQIDTGTKEISKMVLTGTSTGGSGTSATVKASNEIWVVFVHKPWQYLEFGNKTLADHKTDQVLKMQPGKDRTQIFKDLEKSNQFSSTNMGIKRIGFEIMYLIPMFVTFIILSALCLLVLGFQVLTIMIFLFGVIVFVLALIPSFGPKVLGNWALQVAAAAGTKIILVFFLSMMVAFNSALFTHAEEKGWIITLILQLIIFIIIYLKRDSFVEMFMVMKKTIQNPAAANKMLMRAGDPNYAFAGGSYRKGYANRHMRKDDTDEKYNRRSRYEYEEGEEEDSSGRGYERIRASAPIKESPEYAEERTQRAVNDFDNNGVPDSMENKSSSQNSSNGHQHEIKQLLKRAEEVLAKQVEVLKQEAEIKAKRRGTAPEHDPRVRKAAAREKMNLPRFEAKEIQSMAKEIERVERAGGNTDDLVKKRHAPENPRNVISIMERNRGHKEQEVSQDVLTGTRTRAEAAARHEKITRHETTTGSEEITLKKETKQPKTESGAGNETRRTQHVGIRERKGNSAAGNGNSKMRG